MLVYHFKGRLVVLEDKYHTMFDIMNSMVKEMKNLREIVAAIPPPAPVMEGPPTNGFPTGSAGGLGDLFRLFQGAPFPSAGNGMYGGEEEDEEDDDEDDEGEYKKIVVSDTELESDDEEDDVKIISVDMSEPTESVPLVDLEDNLLDQLDVEPAEEKEYVTTDFRKMDVSYLRTLVLARGLAMDTKKMKKSDLVRLLEQSTEGSEMMEEVAE